MTIENDSPFDNGQTLDSDDLWNSALDVRHSSEPAKCSLRVQYGIPDSSWFNVERRKRYVYVRHYSSRAFRALHHSRQPDALPYPERRMLGNIDEPETIARVESIEKLERAAARMPALAPPKPVRRKSGEPVYARAAEELIAVLEERLDASPRYREKRHNAIKQTLNFSWADRPLCMITLVHVLGEIDLKIKGKAAHKRFIYTMVRRVFTFAKSQGYIDSVPLAENDGAAHWHISKHDPANDRNSLALSLDHFWQLEALARERGDNALSVAMRLSLLTSHAVNEIVGIEYKHIDADWLYIIRRKSAASQKTAFVAFAMTDALREVIEESRLDARYCPFVVHRVPKIITARARKTLSHHMQQLPESLSKRFGGLCASSGLYDHLAEPQPTGRHDANGQPVTRRYTPPTFHRIRALSSALMKAQGVDDATVQAAMAHSDQSVTQRYISAGREALSHADYREVRVSLDLETLRR